ncbi:MAG TPA: dicarboxylate/amino acid:cation symporter [Candidatus Aminicenantes bacterium]|nr:dicarboxylate/amino acid:cation symporter [Candidatus Aminicenantes bacterium]HPS99797.1 dicarboxylate/amino acid:cation symporter [Candidatus Aminicenantes bacterium]
MKRGKKLDPSAKILAGVVLGAAAGAICGPRISWIEPIGTLFIRLLTLMILPLVFSSLFVGTASLGDVKRLGRIGAKTLLFYLVTTLIAILIGLGCVNVIKPGLSLKGEVKERLLSGTNATLPAEAVSTVKGHPLGETLLDIVPANPVKAFLEVNLLQVIFLAILFGVAVTFLAKEKGEPLLRFFESLNEAVGAVIGIVMKMAPYAVFALIATLVGRFGSAILLPVLTYILTVAIGLVLHTLVVLPLSVQLFGGIGFLNFLRQMKEVILLSFTTSSSSASLPLTMEAVENRLHVPAYVSSFVLPLGATINQNGTALYQAVAAVFIAQIYGLPLTLAGQATIVLMATLASIGTAGVPSAGTVTLTMILAAINVPLEGLALILAVDRLPDMLRTVGNVLGDAAAAVVVAKSERLREEKRC